MTLKLDGERLREGACYALEHCTHLTEDAATMYAAQRFATSFCLAVMAREELGRFNLLWEQSVELAEDGVICANSLAERLKPHEEKIRAGQSIVPVPMKPEEMRRWTAAITANDTATIEAIIAAVRMRTATVRKHAPSALHKRRLQAQYVDLDPATGIWSTPSSIKKTEARALVHTVMAEIANVLIAAQSNGALLRTSERIGLRLPQMGPFTHNVLGRLVNGDA
ncbi:MAG: AbiV family abortive infection protein [Deltaproteobacteria bacterium]|nr:AbiV family abortive infection protein [Deltaproteobacteria bacterium]